MMQKQREQSIQAHQEHEEREERHESIAEETKGKKNKIFMYSGIAAVILLAIASIPVYSYYFTPGPFDDFAKCLKENGAVMYGADFCQYTKGQRAMFGKSMKHINYQEFTEGEDITVTPTWIIKGERIENAQSFEALAKLTGCKAPI